MASIADRIKEGLVARNMKQVDLVEKTGIGKSSISTYISGEYEPKQKNLYKIAKALGVDISWLMGSDVPMEPKVSNGGMTNYELAALMNTLRNDGELQLALQDLVSMDIEKRKVVLDLINMLKKKEG